MKPGTRIKREDGEGHGSCKSTIAIDQVPHARHTPAPQGSNIVEHERAVCSTALVWEGHGYSTRVKKSSQNKGPEVPAPKI